MNKSISQESFLKTEEVAGLLKLEYTRYNRMLEAIGELLGIDDMSKVERFYLAGMKALIEMN